MHHYLWNDMFKDADTELFNVTDSMNPTDYLKKMRKREPELGIYIGTNCPQVAMMTPSGKRRKTLALLDSDHAAARYKIGV